MTAPVIITVTNSKLHIIARTVVDFSKENEIREKIAEACLKNNWTVKSEVAGTEGYFLSKINNKGF
jgi:hypothetical protein